MPHLREQPAKAPSDEGVPERLRTLFNAGRVRARALGRKVLVSTTERVSGLQAIDTLDPLSTLQMYWAAPREGFALAGIGAAVTLTGAGETRFAEIGRAWQQLVSDAVFHDAAYSPAGGPVLMGGFSFEPEGPHAPHWRGFDSASFIVPRLTFTCRPEACWLTLNALLGEEGDDEKEIAGLVTLRKKILSADTTSETPAERKADTGADTRTDTGKNRYRELVKDAIRTIEAGRLEKVVIAREVRVPVPADFDVMGALRQLTTEHADTFIYAVWRGDAVFFGASPERLARIQGRDVSTSVLAGSARRGATPGEDAQLAAGLLSSAKDRVEHEIVRRELEAALAPVCENVKVELDPSLKTLANVHHLHTGVRARLGADSSVFDVVAALHPTPAVGGAPRMAALEFIREREDMDRGWYAAPVGWVSTTGAEFAVALRCAIARRREASLYAGCGIVAQSDPDAEFEESQIKLRPALEALSATSRNGKHE